MTTFYLGINVGQTENLGNIAVGTSTTSKDIELTADQSKSPTRMDMVKALEAFKGYIESNGVPGGATGTDLPPL